MTPDDHASTSPDKGFDQEQTKAEKRLYAAAQATTHPLFEKRDFEWDSWYGIQ